MRPLLNAGRKKRKNVLKKIRITKFIYLSSSYAKILGKTNFQPQEFPRSGSKAKDVKERKKDRKLVITMASYALQTGPRLQHASHLGQNLREQQTIFLFVLLLTNFEDTHI